jgi:hypothetical protein
MQFSLGINYWPRRSAMAMWRRFDRGEVREDLHRIAGLGLDTVRFFIGWSDFQPEPDRIDSEMLDRLVWFVDAAAETGLRTMPTLFCGHMSGVNWLPSWSLDKGTAHGRFRTITELGESQFGIGDFYTGPLLEAQLALASAVGARLKMHPGIRAWDLGNEFSNMREPATARDAAQWSKRLTERLEQVSGIEVTAGTHSEDLTRDRGIRLSTLCEPFRFATMHGYSVYSEFSRNRLDPEVVPYLAELAASFSEKPLLFSEAGNPTCPPGKASPYDRVAMPDEPARIAVAADHPTLAAFACLCEDEMASYCTAVLSRLHSDGRLGAYWWCWADYANELRDEAPFDRATRAAHRRGDVLSSLTADCLRRLRTISLGSQRREPVRMHRRILHGRERGRMSRAVERKRSTTLPIGIEFLE